MVPLRDGPAATRAPSRRGSGGHAERYAVIADVLAGEHAGRVVIDVGVGVRLRALEHRRVVDRPGGRIAGGPGRPLAAAAELVGVEPRAGGGAADDGPAALTLEPAGAD